MVRLLQLLLVMLTWRLEVLVHLWLMVSVPTVCRLDGGLQHHAFEYLLCSSTVAKGFSG